MAARTGAECFCKELSGFHRKFESVPAAVLNLCTECGAMILVVAWAPMVSVCLSLPF